MARFRNVSIFPPLSKYLSGFILFQQQPNRVVALHRLLEASLNGMLILFDFQKRLKKKNKPFVKPIVMKKQPNVDHITGDKIPKSFVFSRGKLPGSLRQLQSDLRKLMLPYTALKLRVRNFFGFCLYLSCYMLHMTKYD